MQISSIQGTSLFHLTSFTKFDTSFGVGLYDFAMIGATVQRFDTKNDQAVGGWLVNSVVQNLWVEHTKVTQPSHSSNSFSILVFWQSW